MENAKRLQPCTSLKSSILCDGQTPHFFDLPLSDSEIIKLHTMFMTPTKQVIHVKSTVQGRRLMDTMLQSLKYYKNVGCLTSNMWLDDSVIDIYKIIHKDAQVYGLWHAIELFFIKYSQVDFIWIELTSELTIQMSEKYIDQMCQLLTKNQTIPVIIAKYAA